MSCNTDHPDHDDTAARAHHAAILVSLELSRRTWLGRVAGLVGILRRSSWLASLV